MHQQVTDAPTRHRNPQQSSCAALQFETATAAHAGRHKLSQHTIRIMHSDHTYASMGEPRQQKVEAITLFSTTMGLRPCLSAFSNTNLVWDSGPSLASTNKSAPSTMPRILHATMLLQSCFEERGHALQDGISPGSKERCSAGRNYWCRHSMLQVLQAVTVQLRHQSLHGLVYLLH